MQQNSVSLREPSSLVSNAAVNTRTWVLHGFQLGLSSLTRKVQTQNSDRLKEEAVVFILQTVFSFPPETRQEPRIILFVRDAGGFFSS